MTSNLVRIAAAAALAAGSLVSTAAFAQEAGYELVSASVSTAGIDLTTSAGKANVERRLHTAARNVCGDTGERNLRIAAHARACSQEAFRVAQRSLDTAVARAEAGVQVASLSVTEAAAQ